MIKPVVVRSPVDVLGSATLGEKVRLRLIGAALFFISPWDILTASRLEGVRLRLEVAIVKREIYRRLAEIDNET